jgi:hypothetical protein
MLQFHVVILGTMAPSDVSGVAIFFAPPTQNADAQHHEPKREDLLFPISRIVLVVSIPTSNNNNQGL